MCRISSCSKANIVCSSLSALWQISDKSMTRSCLAYTLLSETFLKGIGSWSVWYIWNRVNYKCKITTFIHFFQNLLKTFSIRDWYELVTCVWWKVGYAPFPYVTIFAIWWDRNGSYSFNSSRWPKNKPLDKEPNVWLSLWNGSPLTAKNRTTQLF